MSMPRRDNAEERKNKRPYLYQRGIPTSTSNQITPKASYALSSGNKISHYNNLLNDSENVSGAIVDISNAIEKGEYVILIAGWIFEPQHCYPSNNKETLGEKLLRKAISHPNLEIAILVWRQVKPSENHKQAYNYLLSLAKQKGLATFPSNFQYREISRTGVMWSHHQKFIIVDSQVSEQHKELTAFYGSADFRGISLDFAEHPILDTKENNMVVSKFFREKNIYSTLAPYFDNNTPRTPRHEVMSKVQGPITLDLLTEFISRWSVNHAGAWSSFKGTEDKKQRLIQLYKIITQSDLFKTKLENEENKKIPLWNAQLLRSAEACLYGSFWKLEKKYEKSIHKAYLQAIYQAENFIYIENQYLIGGPAIQSNANDIKNKIPLALVERIVEQHKLGKPFHVFIMLPMIPDGPPGASLVEPLRYQQWQTLNWMMEQIELLTNEFWGKYINFIFPGNWLGLHKDYAKKLNDPNTSYAELITYSGRSQIYVHSKLMIVDDKVVINGSANMNERSMGGPFDSESAVAQWPSSGHEEACIAEVRQFRRELWKTYFGETCLAALGEEGFNSPEKNVSIIMNTTFNNLKAYMTSTVGASKESGFLLTWPFKQEKGHVGEFIEGCEFLPSTPLKDRESDNPIYRWFPASPTLLLKSAKILGHRGFN